MSTTCTCRATAAETSRATARRADQATLIQMVLRQVTCAATGVPLEYASSIVLTVDTDEPGQFFKIVAVTADHWENGSGPMSRRDPQASRDVLDGRLLLAGEADRKAVPGLVRMLSIPALATALEMATA